MQPSLRTLLSGIVDYAGLFPPAKLPLDQAVRNYARYRQEPDRWMLGRFIIPATQLSDLADYDDLFCSEPPFLFSVLGRGGDSTPDFLRGLRTDLEAILQFQQRHQGNVRVDVLEVKLPADVQATADAEAPKQLFMQGALLMEQLGLPRLTPFYEANLAGDWRAKLERLLTALAAVNVSTSKTQVIRLGGAAQDDDMSPQAGFKLRCGGLDASAFPTVAQVGAVITACHLHQVPLKCTAGLHHPLRRFDPSVQTEMHGFVNVFGAAVLAAARPWCEELGQIILNEQAAEAFRFDAEGFRWRDLRVTLTDIEKARRSAAISFGSCSFDEPLEDMRNLGWLP